MQRIIAFACLSIALAGCNPAAPIAKINPPKPNEDGQPGALVDPQAPWPLFGGTPARNMVNLSDKNVPITWIAEEGKR